MVAFSGDRPPSSVLIGVSVHWVTKFFVKPETLGCIDLSDGVQVPETDGESIVVRSSRTFAKLIGLT